MAFCKSFGFSKTISVATEIVRIRPPKSCCERTYVLDIQFSKSCFLENCYSWNNYGRNLKRESRSNVTRGCGKPTRAARPAYERVLRIVTDPSAPAFAHRFPDRPQKMGSVPSVPEFPEPRIPPYTGGWFPPTLVMATRATCTHSGSFSPVRRSSESHHASAALSAENKSGADDSRTASFSS